MQKPPSSQAITEAIRARLLSEGFDCIGITSAKSDPLWQEQLRHFLSKNYHGTMEWLESRHEQRADPQTLWPDAKSIIMMGLNYGPEENPLNGLQDTNCGLISVYARNRDYHDVVKKAQKRVGRWIVENFGGEIKVFVDTAPVMEKPLAQRAGLGWQGKHTNLVSRTHGSWLFLGAIYTTLELDHHISEIDHCGSCKACLDICPTDAFPKPYELDARRCISYLTIEHKGFIPIEFRKAMGNRIYGCDDCLAVCPWNKFAKQAREAKLQARESLKRPSLLNLLSLDDAMFREMFSGSPIKRIGRNCFIRNCLIAAGNSDDASLLTAIIALTEDTDPVVAETAHWAAKELEAAKS